MKLQYCLSAKWFFSFSLIFMFTMYNSFAQQNQPIPLYNGAVPNSKPVPAAYKETENKENGHIANVSQPTLLPFFPEKGKANGTAIVICPGGGYAFLSYEKEGVSIAKKFAEQGVTAFVLKYRLPSDQIMADRSIGPLQDAQRALQLVRENAAKCKIDPAKVGIIGFSAGGHLAATAATQYDKPVIATKSVSSVRPDFVLLLYPVISMGEFTHKGSKENLIGAGASDETTKRFSNELQIKADMPPVFLVHAQDDGAVPIQNSMLFYEGMTAKNIKGELNIYQGGGHGFGLNNKTTTDAWFDRCLHWLAQNKML